jgi:hypothetical protein
MADTSHWFAPRDDSPRLEREEAQDLSEFFELCLENHTVEESIKAVRDMWPTIIFGDGDSGAVFL